MTHPTEGEIGTFERTFTVEDVQRFADLSGDDQSRHTEPDEDGRLMVQGLLTATLPTKIGSDDEVMASSIEFNFHRPVYTGDRLECQSRYDSVEEQDDRYVFTKEFRCENGDGETVLTGTTEGLIWKDS